MFSSFPFRRGKNLPGLLGGFMAILGFLFLPFNGGRSLFSILDGSMLPFLPQIILVAIVATVILYDRDFIYVPCILSTQLLLWMCIFYWVLFTQYPFDVVVASMQIGMYVIPVGLLGLFLQPFFSAFPARAKTA